MTKLRLVITAVRSADKLHFGRAYFRVGKRKRILNEGFWGRWLAKELSLIYDTHACQFYLALPEKKPLQPLNQSQTFSLVTLALQER